AFVVISIGAYIGQLNRMISNNMILNMEELAQHDVQSIQSSLGTNLNRLEFIGQRLQIYDCDTITKVQELLNLERTTSLFDAIYLLDEDGRLYTDSFLIQETDKHQYGAFLNMEQDHFVFRNDEQPGILETRKETVLYGVRMDGLEVEGVRFVAILGQCSITSIQNQLRIDSFGGRGFSSVIDSNGYYIVNINRTDSFNQRDNFFEQLDSGTFKKDGSAESIRKGIAENTFFIVSYTDEDGGERMLGFSAIEGTDWTFVISVSTDVFKEQSRNFILLTAAMLTVVVLALVGMSGLLYRSKQRTVEAHAKAKARSDFLSTMSHEIRTPLNGIIGLNHLMSKSLEDREKLTEYIHKMGNTAQYLLALVNDILDISKLQAGKLDLANENFCLISMLDNLWSMQRDTICTRGISFTIEKDIPYPCIVGDEVRVKQVLMNILSNAAKFTSEGGRITVTVTQQAGEDHTVTTRFRVQDTGCGMSKEFLNHIFDTFTQERNKISSSQKGTGLGMSISYLLMKQMGGDILVESELDKGSCFTVVLPAAICEKKPLDVVKETAPLLEDKELLSPSKRHNILVVEDNELNAEILLEILREEGFTVTHAEDGQKALQAFQASQLGEFDVILMDVQMQVMNGYEAAKAIRGLDRPDAKTVKIFACTANFFREDRERAIESGMDDFLTKPIDVAALLKKLGEV
ncbi:MAG: ATP-binding protein, partial [Clostridia bacterium]